MDLKLNEADTSLRWAKYDNIKNASFMHDNVLLFGGDNALTFINLNDGSSTSQAVTGNIGNGVRCYVGHKLYDIFAFSGACINPKIVLYSYPDFRLISCFQRSDSVSYLTMKFSETEHLIAVAGLPKYELEIWNWRTAKLLAKEQTDIRVDYQVLRVSHSLPLTITQCNPEDGNMNFWEVHTSEDTAKLIKRKIKCPFSDASGPYQMCYGIDGCLFFMNNKFVVFQIYPSTNKCNQIICASTENGISTHINWYKGGVVIAGRDGYLRYFKKIVKDWVEQWSISTSSSITSTFCYNMDVLLVACIDRHLMKLIDDSDASPPKFETVSQFDTAIKYFAIVNPTGKFAVTVNSTNDFCVVDVATDKKISKIALDNISAMVAHPRLPVVAYGNAFGYLFSLLLSDPAQPSYLSKFYLTTCCIKSLNYSSNGRTIVAYTSDNNIFVAQYLAGGKMYVTNQIPLTVKLLHLTINDNSIETHITALCMTSSDTTTMISSDRLLHITVVGSNCTTNEIELSNAYTSIEYLNDGFDKFVGVPFKKIEFEVITLTRSMHIETETTIRTPHLLKYFQIQVYAKFLVTFGVDGLVIVWDSNAFEIITSFFPHNKRFGGVMKCVADANLSHTSGHCFNSLIDLQQHEEYTE